MKEKKSGFLHQNRKLLVQFIFTALFIGLASWFISHERPELVHVRSILGSSSGKWIGFACTLFAVYVILQGLMYVEAFASAGISMRPWEAVILFLKRNFISIFLPAGGVASMAFFTGDLEKRGVSRTKIFIGSSIYSFVGILSLVIVAIPAFMFVVTGGSKGPGKWFALLAVSAVLALIVAAYFSLKSKGGLYRAIAKVFPKSEFYLNTFGEHTLIIKRFISTIILSVFIEFTGIALVFVSMGALNANPSLSVAIITYIVVVLFLILSPFLRGLGTIEVSMTYVLIKSGLSNAEAIAVTLFFRFFEFWLPLFAGILTFLSKINRLLFRLIPALLLFCLGIVNIISVLTPALPERLKILHDFLLTDLVSFSNSFVLVAGLFMLVTASFMLRGLKSAWWVAVALTIISVFGHITKGIDYEEAIVAFLILVSLIVTRKEYNVRTNPRLSTIGWQVALLSMVAVVVFGTTGFYFLDPKHFHIDFNFGQSVKYSLLNFLLVGSRDLIAYDSFARDFIYMIRITGFISIGFLVISIVKPYFYRGNSSHEEFERAKELTGRFGKSSMDYFKTYSDKIIFAPGDINAFISYKVTGSFAVVLEAPVAENDTEMKKCILSFRKYCFENSLREIYYRVPEEALPVFSEAGMKSLYIGQEGIVDLSTFTLEGGDKKSIRNAINKVIETGYKSNVYTPPVNDGVVQKLRAVSDDWLRDTGRKEILFSQGRFDESEIKGQVVIAAESQSDKIISFLNLIPDYSPDEATYDLLRKTHDAPNGIMDFMIIEMFKYFRTAGYKYLNLGFAPLSGIDDPHNFPERTMKFVYEKIGSFSHYRGQRDYKEKFKPVWKNKYLVYTYDYDLIQVPGALTKIINE
jgi:phosphatidylglycerol lysyltransferase